MDSSSSEASSQPRIPDPETAEVVPGTERQELEGWVPALATPEELQVALEHAFDYRGDVSITRKDGSKIEGYVFDRRGGKSLEDSAVRVMPKTGGKVSIKYSEIAALAFTGRDMAAGKGWENWVRNYWQKKAAGEKNISLEPEELE
jgi:hypothetical protein